MLNIDFSFNQLAKITKAEVISIDNTDIAINNIIIDSRKASDAQSCIFVALKSNRNDGHNYIQNLFDKGFRYFLISDYKPNLPKANYLIVKDSLKALQKIGKKHKEKFNLNTIAITGSNGKTIVKEWLFQLLLNDYKIVRSPKSFNSQIGVPLSVMQINKSFDLGIFEAGISMPNEMENLAEIINPNIGLFLNIGPAHAENFANIKQKINEKLQLFKSVDTLIFCRDYGEISEQIFQHQLFRNKELIYWSKQNKEANLFIKDIKSSPNKAVASCLYKEKEFELIIPFSDSASIENAIHCSLLLLHFGYNPEKINSRLSKLTPVAMRLELKKGINNCSIINDSYNSDINSLNIAIDFLKQQKQSKKYVLILSDILQSGKRDYALYESIGDLLKEKGINKIIGIGKAISRNADKFEIEKSFFNSTDDFINYYPFSEFSNETILLKGARKFEFERISRLLEERTHETVLEVNLTSLIDNYNYFKSIIGAKTKIMAMVKAFSYGSGSFELANILQYQNADYLAVAYADEGVELRKAGINTPIMVMNPQIDSFEFMTQYKLEPEIFSLRLLNEFIVSVNKSSINLNKEFGIHLKIETGMKRLGFEQNQIDELIQILKNNPKIKVKSIFSHLAAADDLSKKEFSLSQINQLKNSALKIEKALGYEVIKHIANSAAIINFPESHFDMVRLGISLYGFSANQEVEKELRNVSTLKTVISQIKTVEKGESIGYNQSFVANKNMKIAIIPIGYADGLNRLLSNSDVAVKIKNKNAKIIGNICMDMTMIDIDGLEAAEGDEVVVFDNQEMVKNIAKTIGTIEYEILTGIGRRVKRIYFQE